MLRASNVKPKFFKKWHNKAMLIDIRKTKLIIEEADSEDVPTFVDPIQLNRMGFGSQLMEVEDLEEPQKERTSFHWLTQALSSLGDILA